MRRLASLWLVLFAAAAHADEPPTFAPFDVRRGTYLAEIRAEPGQTDGRGWRVTVFDVADDPRRELWSAPILHTGYAWEHHLTDDGKALVTVEEWLRPGWPVVRVLHEGELLAQYFAEDLQVPPAALQATRSHQTWLARSGARRVNVEGSRLGLVLGDGTTRAIQLVSGRIEGLPDEETGAVVARSPFNDAGERAQGRLMDALLTEKIRSASVGELGAVHLHVDAADAPRARRIVATCIEAQGLAASVVR